MHRDGNYNVTVGGLGESKGELANGYNATKDQRHQYKAYFGFKAALDDNFKVYVQFQYNSADAGFYNNSPAGEPAGTNADINNSLDVKQMYFEYNNAEFNTQVRLGKQRIDSIWTDDSVANGAKIFNNSIEHITLAAFWFDDYSYDDMLALPGKVDLMTGKAGPGHYLIDGSTYGGAVFANYDPFSVQLWGAYNNNLATLYAINADAHDTFFGNLNLGVQAQWLGNSVETSAKVNYNAKNGNYYAGKIYGDWANDWGAIDFSTGYYQYGDKDKFTLTTIEDTGHDIIYAGESLIYSNGAMLTGDTGQNKMFFGTLGYTYDKFRIGVDYVGGTTDRNVVNGMYGQADNSIDKNEVVGRLTYKYSPKLTFSSFYSWYQQEGILEANSLGQLQQHDETGKFIRFQALYTW